MKNMETIQIKVPENILKYLQLLTNEQEIFVLEAIEEKIEREKKKNLEALLIEGYSATQDEVEEITKDFEDADLEGL